jgi:hypothetical protein
MSSNRELLTATYVAFNARDIDAVLAMMHPDVDWPNGWEGGRIHGRANVRDYWERQWAVLNPRVEALRIEDDETGRTVVDVHQVVRDLAGNTVADQIVQHVYSIKNGLIEQMDIRKPDAIQPSETSDRPWPGWKVR